MLPRFNLDRVRENVRAAETEDLLDRVTVYRAGMEEEALEIIDAELRRRDVTENMIRRHAQRHADVISDEPGVAQKCSFCRRPALASGWGWQRLFGKIPVFPRYLYYCDQHCPHASC
jgi:hypothetical protein